MKLISHAIKNIKDNFKNYAVYFTLMCIISCVIYSFLALLGNEAVKLVVRDSGFLPTSFFLILVLGASTVALFFLVSSSISFIRARKREFLTDELTGAENAQTGNRSFLETFILGAVATIAGIAFGIFFSKLVTMFFLKMTTSSYSGDIYFSVEINAIIATIIVFLAVFYFVKLSRGRGHNKLNSEKMYKEIKESEEKITGSYFMLIISLVLILGGYFLAFTLDAYAVNRVMFVIFAMVVGGTYLFFGGRSQKALYCFKIGKKNYYKGSNLISASLITYRGKSVAITMASIVILLATSATTMALGDMLLQTAKEQTYRQNDFDLYFSTSDETLMTDVNALFDRFENSIVDEIRFDRYRARLEGINIPERGASFFGEDNYLDLFCKSQYNAIVDITKNESEQIELERGSIVLISNFIRGEDNWEESKLLISNREFDITIAEEGFICTWGNRVTIVLHDEDFNELVADASIRRAGQSFLKGINYTNALTSSVVASELSSLLKNRSGGFRISYFTYNEFLANFGLIFFIGVFMCLVFILMTASMLFFQQAIITMKEKPQYKLLENIGADSDMISKIIGKRLLPVFFVPLLMGITHSIFAMKAAHTMLSAVGWFRVTISYISTLKTSAMVYIVFIIVYTVFYFITKEQYRRIIR